MRNRLWFSVWKNVNKTWEKKLLTLINDIILGGKAGGFFNAKLRKATQNLTSLQKCLEVFLRRGKNVNSMGVLKVFKYLPLHTQRLWENKIKLL